MALPNTDYLLLRGKIALAERDAVTGVTGKVLYVGNCPAFKLSLKTEKIEHFESMSGKNQKDREIVKTIGADVSLTLENIAKSVLSILCWSAPVEVASLAAQQTILPNPVVVNEYYLTKDHNLTVVTVEDSAGTPVVVTNTKYTVDPIFGTITFNDIAGYTQPFKVKYTRGAESIVPFFSTQQPERYLRFEGVNIGNPGNSKNHIVELYKLPITPVADLDFIGDDLGKFEMQGSALVDPTRESDPNLGQFGRLIYL